MSSLEGQTPPPEKQRPRPYLVIDNVNNPPILPVEEQMKAHGVFAEAPLVPGETINKITTGIEELREHKTSENILKESLEITKDLEARKSFIDSKAGEVEEALKAYAQRQKEKAESKPQAPEVKIAPDQVIEPKKEEPPQTLKETLKHSFVGDIGAGLERVKIGIASEPFLAAYESFYQLRHGRTVQKEVKMLGFKKEAESREEKLGQVNKAIEQSKKDGKYTAEVAKLYEREKDTYTKEIERLKIKQDKAHARWEKSSNKDAYWRNRQKQVAEGAIGKLEEKARPYAHKFEELREKHTATEAKIEGYKTTKEKEVAALSAFEKKIRDPNIDTAKRAVLELQAEQIREALAENEKAYNAELVQRRRIEGKMNATNRRLGRWQGMSNEMARMGNRPHAPADHEAAKEGVEERHESNFSHAPESALVGTPTVSNLRNILDIPGAAIPPMQESVEVAPASPETPPAAPTQEAAEAMQVKPADYIKKWNELFKNGPTIDAKVLTDFYRIKLNESIDSKTIEDTLIKMLLPGVPMHKAVFEEGMRARFAKTREALKKK